jgi:hypothetical protein
MVKAYLVTVRMCWHSVISMFGAAIDNVDNKERLVTCGSSHHHFTWNEPPQLSTSSTHDGNEMSTTVEPL